jgi:hypothetical protein
MEMLFLVLVVLVGLMVWLQYPRGTSGGRSEASPKSPVAYVKKNALLSPAERSFYGVLRQAASETYQVHAKVRLADLIQLASELQ